MGARWAEMRSAAVAAEEAGFDGLWTWDHLRDPDGDPAGVPESLTTLAALAEVTRHVTLGPLVLNVANRHPGILANMAATIQQVSGGRFILALGAGGGRRTHGGRARPRALQPERLHWLRARLAPIGFGEPRFPRARGCRPRHPARRAPLRPVTDPRRRTPPVRLSAPPQREDIMAYKGFDLSGKVALVTGG